MCGRVIQKVRVVPGNGSAAPEEGTQDIVPLASQSSPEQSCQQSGAQPEAQPAAQPVAQPDAQPVTQPGAKPDVSRELAGPSYMPCGPQAPSKTSPRPDAQISQLDPHALTDQQ